MLAVIVAAQVVGLGTWEADRKAFAPYKACVLERVTIYSQTGETIESITAAAFSDCRTKRAMALLDSLENVLSIDIKNRNPTGDTAAGANQNFDQLEKMLKEDVAAVVLRARVK